MSQYLIEVENLWKRYRVTQQKRRSLKDMVVNGLSHRPAQQAVWALQNVSFQVERGQTLGIIGNNGAGKSTLLRLLSGLGRPTQGKVTVRERVASLLELGAGFNADLTGRENIYIGGLVAGFTRNEVTARLEQIVDFAELEAVIDTAVRTYSTGMYMRLAFANAINYDPALLIVDEALSVGDIRFRKKCADRMQQMRRNGTTIIIVTHLLEQAQELCDQSLWLEQGQVRMYGSTSEVLSRYKERVFSKVVAAPGSNRTDSSQKTTAASSEMPNDSHEIEIKSVRLTNEYGTEVDTVTSGDPLNVQVDYIAHQPVTRPIFMVGIFREDGLKCYESSTEADGVFIDRVEGAGTFSISYASLPLMRGAYWLGISVYDESWDKAFDYKDQMAPFEVTGAIPGTGIFHPPHKWTQLA